MDISEIFSEFFVFGKNTREIETQTENPTSQNLKITEVSAKKPPEKGAEPPTMDIIKEETEEEPENTKETKNTKQDNISTIYINNNFEENVSNFIKNKKNKPIIFLVKDDIVKQEMKMQLLENGIFDCVCVNSVKNIKAGNDCNIVIDLNIVDDFDEFVNTIEEILSKASIGRSITWSVLVEYNNVSRDLLEDVFDSFKHCNIIYDKNKCPKKFTKIIKNLNESI
jgi:hypothetical protein